MTELGIPKASAACDSGTSGIHSDRVNPGVGDAPMGSTEFGRTTRPAAGD